MTVRGVKDALLKNSFDIYNRLFIWYCCPLECKYKDFFYYYYYLVKYVYKFSNVCTNS